ncbi:hypothetical protein [Halobacteriovorax sp. HLS]|uniref:hypothetical protein n=1 Tax=Halobacteriovorax sp. HLS TaxID=2234000 RepID=UPI000FD996D2|nr:hypothetical protein [Halobacteriovorax sp. HLS]
MKNLNQTKEFKIFKELTIGGLNKDELLQRLSAEGIQFNDYANTLFEHPHFTPSETIEVVKLVMTTLSDLGLKETCTPDEFSNRISELGLEFCPLYLAAFLRLDYLDQNERAYLTVASVKPELDENYPNGFYLRNIEDTLWLRGYRADGFEGWPEVNEFIFISSSRR